MAASPQRDGGGVVSMSLGTSPPKAREVVRLVLDFESRLETCHLGDLWRVTPPF